MTKILFLTSSPRGAASQSTRIGRQIVDQLVTAHPGAQVLERDLAASPLPHLDGNLLAGLFTPPDGLSEAQKAALLLSDTLVDELLAADIVVICAGMINFGVTSTLKSWFDHVARAGRTFRYSAEGKPEGLATGKKVYLVDAHGGIYQGPMQAMDFQLPYLKHMLGFLGLTDVTVVTVDGQAMGPEAAAKGAAAAEAQAAALFVRQAA